MPTARAAPSLADRRVKLVSLVIVGALGLQLVALLVRSGPWAFPFINYPMYADAHYLGDRVTAEHTVYALFADGSEAPISRAELGKSYWHYELWAKRMVAFPGDTYVLGAPKPAWREESGFVRRQLKQILSRDDIGPRLIEVITAKIESSLGKTVVGYRIEDFPAVLTHQGFVNSDGPEVRKTLEIRRPAAAAGTGDAS